MKQMDESGIPCRVLRTELVKCESDIEYLCKLHCIRLAFQGVFHLSGAEQWFTSAGRSLLADLLRVADKDPRDVLDAYDAMVLFVRNTEQRFKMVAEMEHRGELNRWAVTHDRRRHLPIVKLNSLFSLSLGCAVFV